MPSPPRRWLLGSRFEVLELWGISPRPPSKQNNLRFLHKQKQNMKGFLQNPLLMSWLSRHLSGLMRMDIPDMLREAWKSHTHSNCHFITVNAVTLSIVIFTLAADGGYGHVGVHHSSDGDSSLWWFLSWVRSILFLQFPLRLKICSYAFLSIYMRWNSFGFMKKETVLQRSLFDAWFICAFINMNLNVPTGDHVVPVGHPVSSLGSIHN